MANVEIRIELEGGEPEHGWLRYAPGATVQGTVHVRSDDPLECRHVWVRLEWQTEGRGTRDTGKIAEQSLFQGHLPGDGITQRFALVLPDQPHSYRGRLVSIVWGVVVELDVTWMKKPRSIQSFVMAPAPHPARDQRSAPVPQAEEGPSGLLAPAGWDLILVSPGLQFRELGQALMEVMPEADIARVQRVTSIDPLHLLRNVPEEQARKGAARLQAAGATMEVRPANPEDAASNSVPGGTV